MQQTFEHAPVMLQQCIDALAIKPDGIYVDGTAGGGGHSAAIASQLQSGCLYAIDQDPAALAAAGARLQGLPAKVLQGNYREVQPLLAKQGVTQLDGALLDLGVSSHQLDTVERGFSYRADAPLDMRMSQAGPTAADLLNSLSRQEIADILRQYGEEPYAWQIAGRVEAARMQAPLQTTGQLVELINAAIPAKVRRKDKNPARRTFQALRIAVNGELDALDEGLDAIFALLKPGGRFAILTFHSLEDRAVKQRFRTWSTACHCPPEMPVCQCGGHAQAMLIGKNPQIAGEEELSQNRRSRSAKLRVLEKLA